MLIDKILLFAIRYRLRHRPSFFDAVGTAALAYWREVKAAESAARVSQADEAIKTLARRVEIQRIITDYAEQTTTPLPIQ